MIINILTLFPELYPGPLGHSILGEALKKKSWELNIFNLRDFAKDKRKTVDDLPYGGGSGMVLKADILSNAIDNITNGNHQNYIFLYPSPKGEVLNQKKTVEFANKNNILIICGRYEGIDQRIIDKYHITEFSIGDYVLSCGEIASYILVDAVVRLLPDTLGNHLSLTEESFAVGTKFENLLEYPHYTRPAIWNDMEVPEILRSGNHQKISEWRFSEAQKITRERRPDLWAKFKKQNI